MLRLLKPALLLFTLGTLTTIPAQSQTPPTGRSSPASR